MFELIKIAESALNGGNILFSLIAVAAASIFFKKTFIARISIYCAFMICMVVTAIPWRNLLLNPLEEYYSPPVMMPDQVDGVIVLGGAIDPGLSHDRGLVALNSAAERMTSFVTLSRRYPLARLVFSGGSGDPFHQDLKEATYARTWLTDMGVSADRVIFEDQSRTTFENAQTVSDLLHPAPDQTWILVTSAVHMPRSMAVFCKAGWQLLPYPVNYQTSTKADTPQLGLSRGFGALSTGLHEWAGMLYYRIRGWTDSVLPDKAVCGKTS